jgi:hypothetical protein
MIPVPKDFSKANDTEHFRGIIISPIISKVFELCLLNIYCAYLTTSERQFGFKKHSSTAQAIFIFTLTSLSGREVTSSTAELECQGSIPAHSLDVEINISTCHSTAVFG